MSDSDSDLHKIATQYLELWQKQLLSQSNERTLSDGLKLAEAFNQQSAEFMKTLDTPDKVQNWMASWTESWKEQFKDGTNPFAPFTDAQTRGAASAGDASGNDQRHMDELSRRVERLEERIADLESRLKEGS